MADKTHRVCEEDCIKPAKNLKAGSKSRLVKVHPLRVCNAAVWEFWSGAEHLTTLTSVSSLIWSANGGTVGG